MALQKLFSSNCYAITLHSRRVAVLFSLRSAKNTMQVGKEGNLLDGVVGGRRGLAGLLYL